MPNHIKNIITLKGDEKKIRKMLETIQNDNYGLGSVDFNKIIPMPKSLDIESGSRTDRGLKIYRDFILIYTLAGTLNKDLSRIPKSSEEAFLKARADSNNAVDLQEWELGKTAWNNIHQYGASTWYDWCVQNWGTKWNAYGYGEDTIDYHDGDMLHFQTAWSAPHPVLEKLSKMFPDIELEHEWADEDIGQNCGRYSYQNGKRIEGYRPNNETEAIEFACRMWEYDPADLDLCLNAEGTKYIDIENEEYQQIELFGKPALFTNDRLTNADIPQGMYCYHLRHSDDGVRFCSVEPKVGVNHGGSVITKEPLGFGTEGYIPFTNDTEPNFTGEKQTLGEFLNSINLQETGGTDNVWDTYLGYVPLDTAYSATAPFIEMGGDYFDYIKILNVPTIPDNCDVTGASLNLYLSTFTWDYLQYEPYTRQLNLSEVTQFWNEYTFESSNDNFIYDDRYEIFSPWNHPSTANKQIHSADIISYSDEYGVYSVSLEIPTFFWNNSGGFNSYFSSYYGFEIELDYRSYGKLYTSEHSNTGYRPSIQVRYTVNQVLDIQSGKLYRMKNVGSGNYLTVKDGGISGGANVYQSALNTSNSHQVVRITYNTTIGAYYIRPYNTMYSNAADIRFDSYNSSNYANICTGSGGYWAIGGSAGGYTLHDIYSPSYVMSVYGNTTGTGSTTGASKDNIGSAKYSASNAKQKWVFELCPNQYNTNSVNKTEFINVGDVCYLIPSLVTQGWNNSNSSVVDVDQCGRVTAIQSGKAILRDSNTNGQNSIITIEVLIPDGEYFIRNREDKTYLQIEDGDKPNYNTDQAKIEARPFTGENYQRWNLIHVSYKYYKIESSESGMVIAVAANKESSENNSLIQETYTGSDRQLWSFDYQDSGAYIIRPKSAESLSNDWCMATGDLLNNKKVQQRECLTTNDSYKEEWFISEKRIFISNVNMFFDHGYNVWYGENENTSISNLNSYINKVAQRYYDLFGLIVIKNSASYYHSLIDICKGQVDNNNINDECTSTSGNHSNCTILFNSVSNHFKKSFPSNDMTTNVYWSAHLIRTEKNSTETNRSYSSNREIYILKRSVTDRTRNSQGVLMHELNHQYGAPDHYHEIVDGKCRGGDICSECGTNPRPKTCIMYSSSNNINSSNIICSECQNDILNYLGSHH